jgi:uncharacterized membrane protein
MGIILLALPPGLRGNILIGMGVFFILLGILGVFFWGILFLILACILGVIGVGAGLLVKEGYWHWFRSKDEDDDLID